MDDVRPWIMEKAVNELLEKSSEVEPSSSLLPLEPFQTQKIQFIRFLSPHQWGSHEPVWAEASDRDVTMLVYISSEIIQKFELDRQADQRTFSQLGFPTFSLGGCCWIWDAPPNKSCNGTRLFRPQICLKVVSDLPRKCFQIGSVATSPAASFRSQKDSKQSRHLYQLDSTLRHHPTWGPQWTVLIKGLQVTNDPRFTISGSINEINPQNPSDIESLVHVTIPHPGITSRARHTRQKKRQSKPYSKPIELPTKPVVAPGPLTVDPSSINTSTKNHEVNEPTYGNPKKHRNFVRNSTVSHADMADESDTCRGKLNEALNKKSPNGNRVVNVVGKDLPRSKGINSDGLEDHNIEMANVNAGSTSVDRIVVEQEDRNLKTVINTLEAGSSLEHQSKTGFSVNFGTKSWDAEAESHTSTGQLGVQEANQNIDMIGLAHPSKSDLRKSMAPCCTAANTGQIRGILSSNSLSKESRYKSGHPSSTLTTTAQIETPPEEKFLIYFSSNDYPKIDHSNILTDSLCPLSSSEPFVLKIKGRNLSKYFS
ncbi:hypothetical protein MJO28_012465 [Puccinia striiformis f. sp. tritici]|uniref:Uncharacterized protein n=1 Tax=Puccinia striiformis f. sp. tritici TaxID=168172 RepID=A0ACC0E2Z2_9BASI|nr:hypothetical protein MJO28_012465 [Puccinia striiformis f. sp. tritici]